MGRNRHYLVYIVAYRMVAKMKSKKGQLQLIVIGVVAVAVIIFLVSLSLDPMLKLIVGMATLLGLIWLIKK